MIRKLLLALLALTFASAAHARAWTVAQQTPSYTASHPLKAHDAADAYSYEPADIASNFTTSTWIHSDCPGGSVCGQYAAPGSGSEAKARFDCNITFEAFADPIIGVGSHDHSFFGNIAAAANPGAATYTSLRSSGNSTCYGGPLNRSLYWEPSVKKVLANGATVTIKPKNIVTYYEQGALAAIGTGTIDDPLMGSRWPRSIEMIFGFNMSDPTESYLNGIMAAANAASTPGRYSRVAATVGGGFRGWACVTPNTGATTGGHYGNSPVSGDFQPYLRNANGTAALDCAPNTDLIAEFLSYPCWDGVNFTSPDGRKHFMPYLYDNTLSKYVCPDNWVRVTQFRSKVTFNQTGSADYKEWWFASDRMDANPVNWFKNGESGHADLIPAWDYGTAAAPGVFLKFQVNCDGITVTISGTTLTGDGHECGTGRISSAQNLYVNEASPDGSSPNPIVVLSPDQTGPLRYFPGTTGSSIPSTIRHCHETPC